ncbi:hypothetical protein BDN67DRAFT_573582 [Paxillus ammoniavirescens]|nr:hypothetical protein BDN67DRAFT_573582 [Paxillus ammoniavirescens]
MRLSGESPSAEPYPSETPVGDSKVLNQPESIETVTIRETSTLSAHASPQPTPSTGPLSSTTATSYRLSTSTANVATTPLIVSSAEERAFVEEYRRLKDQSLVVRMVAEPLSSPEHDRDSYIHRESSMSPAQSLGPVTPSALSTPLPISPQTRLDINAGLSPALDVSSATLSPLPLSAASRHSHSLHQPSTTDVVYSLDLTTPVGNTVVEARGNIKMVSSGSSGADEADRQRVVSHLQEQNEQLRRQLHHAVAAIRKAELERDGPATGTHHRLIIYCTQVTNKSGFS